MICQTIVDLLECEIPSYVYKNVTLFQTDVITSVLVHVIMLNL